MPLPTDPETPPAASRRRVATGPGPDRLPGGQARLLRSALAGGRLPLGALRLTILRALDAELRRRGRSVRERRLHRDRAGRFLDHHGDRRRVPPIPEVRRWAQELARRGRADTAEAEALLRSVRLLYAAVLGRGREEGAATDEAPSPGRRAASSGPVTGGGRRERSARQ